MQNEIKENIAESKNYCKVCNSTIERTIKRELPKYKKKKDVEQSVRAKLHAWITMFYDNYGKVLKNNENASINYVVEDLLQTHVSTKERYSFLEEFYDDINREVPNINSIIDLGCGFNPIAYFKYSNKATRYEAVDVEAGGVDLLNAYFKENKLDAIAIFQDIFEYQFEKEVDVVFLFKILPLLDQQKKNFSKELLKNIRSKYICITYPTKTLSGKNVGMYNKYKLDLESALSQVNYRIIFEKEYKNEILFILKK